MATQEPSWWPTRKWWTATILAVAGLLSTWAQQGWNWSDTLWGVLITLIAQRIVAYIVPNAATVGGVPAKGGSKV